jgi:hypothetical protein
MPLQKLFRYGKRSFRDNLPAILVSYGVDDSYGDILNLRPVPQLSVLELSATAIPENVEPFIPLALVILILGTYSHRKVQNG